ncbi:hypothetical protein L6452_35767 [Arctium lappa]|uniref:Uncharacterized protein n=1 Tax=Arctium lappa TaxID=4217 RepID=A0ACB8Y7W0_ARCLA|nr:hypothetical protein L6452_35767 [Arctium lappa]
MLFTYKSDSAIRQLHSSAWHSSSNTSEVDNLMSCVKIVRTLPTGSLGHSIARIFPQRHGKGPSHRKDSNLSAEKGKGRSKQKERKAHHIGQRHQQLKKDKILAEAEKEEEKEERTTTITSLDELQLCPFVNEGIEIQRKYG